MYRHYPTWKITAAGKAYFAVDPLAPANRDVVNLKLGLEMPMDNARSEWRFAAICFGEAIGSLSVRMDHRAKEIRVFAACECCRHWRNP